MGLNFQSFITDNLEYFKSNILTGIIIERDNSIKETILYLIAVFMKQFGIAMWPELLEIINIHIDNKDSNEVLSEILNIVLKNSKNVIDTTYLKLLNKILDKIINCVSSSDNALYSYNYISNIEVFIEYSPVLAVEKMREIIPVLKQYSNSSDSNIKNKIGRSWNSVIRLSKDYLNEYYESLINFFINNFTVDNYDQSVCSAKFFMYITSEESFTKNENIKQYIKSKLGLLIPTLVQCMKLSEDDISYLNTKLVNEENHSNHSNNNNSTSSQNSNASNNSNHLSNSNQNSNSNDSTSGSNGTDSGTSSGGSSEDDEGGNISEGEIGLNKYNPDETLRKFASRTLQKISFIFPVETFGIMRSVLEDEMQSNDNLIRESAILACGAIGEGCYAQMINHLKIVVPFLIRELRQPYKFVRAISCWTLSKFTKYILVDNYYENKNELFRWYLTEILTKFLDKENIVRGYAGVAFQEMIKINKIVVEPYLFDVFQIISKVFEKYTGKNLLQIYIILILLFDEFPDAFKNQNLVRDLVKSIVQKWYDLVKTNDLSSLISFFEVVGRLIGVCGVFLVNYCDFFLAGCLKLIEQYLNEFKNISNLPIEKTYTKLVIKSLDTISLLSIHFKDFMKHSMSKFSIVELIINIFVLNIKENAVLHYALILLCDLLQLEQKILLNGKCAKLLNFIMPLIEIKSELAEGEKEKLAVCIYAIRLLSIVISYYPDDVMGYIDAFIDKTKNIVMISKINKTLARNISICIGKLGVFSPEKVSKYIEIYLQPFCVSLKHLKDNEEKREAFKGMLKAIGLNPKGGLNSFNFLCDMLCGYEHPPDELEKDFQSLIGFYMKNFNEKSRELISNFPPNLKVKMKKRFKIETI